MVGQQIVHNTFSPLVSMRLSRSLQRGVKGWLLDPLRGRPMCAFDRTPGHKSQQMGYQEKKRDKMTKNDPAMIYNKLPILPTQKIHKKVSEPKKKMSQG
mgnify:CR=1 FL=1